MLNVNRKAVNTHCFGLLVRLDKKIKLNFPDYEMDALIHQCAGLTNSKSIDKFDKKHVELVSVPSELVTESDMG